MLIIKLHPGTHTHTHNDDATRNGLRISAAVFDFKETRKHQANCAPNYPRGSSTCAPSAKIQQLTTASIFVHRQINTCRLPLRQYLNLRRVYGPRYRVCTVAQYRVCSAGDMLLPPCRYVGVHHSAKAKKYGNYIKEQIQQAMLDSCIPEFRNSVQTQTIVRRPTVTPTTNYD